MQPGALQQQLGLRNAGVENGILARTYRHYPRAIDGRASLALPLATILPRWFRTPII